MVDFGMFLHLLTGNSTKFPLESRSPHTTSRCCTPTPQDTEHSLHAVVSHCRRSFLGQRVRTHISMALGFRCSLHMLSGTTTARAPGSVLRQKTLLLRMPRPHVLEHCVQDPDPHSGGQEWMLQGCTWAGAITGQSEWGATSSRWYVTFLMQRILRVCCPPPHVLLHTPHWPVVQ